MQCHFFFQIGTTWKTEREFQYHVLPARNNSQNFLGWFAFTLLFCDDLKKLDLLIFFFSKFPPTWPNRKNDFLLFYTFVLGKRGWWIAPSITIKRCWVWVVETSFLFFCMSGGESIKQKKNFNKICFFSKSRNLLFLGSLKNFERQKRYT